MQIKFGNYKKQDYLTTAMIALGIQFWKHGSSNYKHSHIIIDFLWYYIEFTWITAKESPML